MTPRSSFVAALIALGATVLVAPAEAQFAVIDVAAVNQLVQQMSAWQQQLLQMRLQLLQLEQTRLALTGPRGMQGLLPLTPADRNYLPTTATGLAATALGGGPSAALSASVGQYVTGNAVLSAQDLALLPPGDVARLTALRQTVALREALMGEAYARSSDRFAALGVLIDSIGTATDAKAAADLGARIGAEQSMLQNENAKIATFDHYGTALREADDLAVREAIVKGHGRFATRFIPTNPVP